MLFDFARTGRIGLPEAVFCQGKPLNVLIDLLRRFSSGKPPILFTRLASDVRQGLPQDARASYDHDALSSTAFAARMPKNDKGKVAIVSAGAADAPVSHEAARTLDYLGITNTIFEDCGVAGLWRLAHHLEQINDHDAVIVVAGMEGALAKRCRRPLPAPDFCRPHFNRLWRFKRRQGGSRWHAGQLRPGISCLNIDNGYGAACAAARVVNLL